MPTNPPLRAAVAVIIAALCLPAGLIAQSGDGFRAPVLRIDVPPRWEAAGPTPLDRSNGGYTYAINHTAEHVAVTLYVYQRDAAPVPDDLRHAAVVAEFNAVRDAVRAMQGPGRYDKVSEESAGEEKLGAGAGAPACHCARFAIEHRGVAHRSEAYLLPFRGYFLKLRITRVAEAADRTQADLDALLSAIVAATARR